MNWGSLMTHHAQKCPEFFLLIFNILKNTGGPNPLPNIKTNSEGLLTRPQPNDLGGHLIYLLE